MIPNPLREMNPKETLRILDAVAADYISADVNLLPKIMARLERKTLVQNLRARPALLILFVLLALSLLTGVVYAVGRLAGFIPGFGFVSDASTARVLETPVEVTENGLTARVERAVNDGTRFWVEVTLSQNPHPGTIYDATILLPDGQMFAWQQSDWREPASTGKVPILFEFPPLPAETESLTLQFKYSLPGKTDWANVTIPFQLRPLQPNEIIPVQPTDGASRQSETHDGLTLVLDNVAPASDKTVLQVSLRFEQPQTWLNSEWGVTLTGADGKVYPLTDITSDVSDDKTRLYETLPFAGGETLTLSLVAFPDSQNLPLSVDFSANAASFTFDPGPAPQVEQTWQLDETVQVGTYKVHVVGAKMASPSGLVFEFAPIENVTGVMLYNEKATGMSGGIPVPNGNFTAGITFDKIPAEPFDIKITRVYYTAHGVWQIQWQAPTAPQNVIVGPTGTPIPTPAVYATVTSSDPLLLEVHTLAQKFDAPFQQGPGWIHSVRETETNPRAGQTFPPPYIAREEWLELDADGYVIRSILTDRDKDGNVIQQVVSIGNYYINFTTGDSGYNEYARYPFSTDMLTQDLNQAAPSQITREEVTCDDGSACLLITMYYSFAQPAQNPGETVSFSGGGRRTWINLQTGQEVKIQSFRHLQDGTERVDYTETTPLVEKLAAPPQEILDILSRVVVP